MSRPIYKPIGWEDAAIEIRENNGKRLFIEIENGDLNRADCFRLEVGRLMAESWYIRYEKEEHFDLDNLPVRPEISV